MRAEKKAAWTVNLLSELGIRCYVDERQHVHACDKNHMSYSYVGDEWILTPDYVDVTGWSEQALRELV